MSKLAARRVRAMTLPLLPLAGMATPLWAQSTSAPTPTPTPLPNLIPGLENFSLQPGPGTTVTRPATPPPVVRTVPTPTPTPGRPRVVATPQPRATATPMARATPTPTPAPTQIPAVTPTPAAPVAPPAAEPVAPVQAVSPPVTSPVASEAPATGIAAEPTGPSWLLLGGGGAIALLLGGLGFWFLQRREAEDGADVIPEQGAHARFDLAADLPDVPPEPAGAPSVFRPATPAPVTPPAPPAQAAFDLGTPPKRGKHAIFDLGAVESALPPPVVRGEIPAPIEETAPPPPPPPPPPPLPPPLAGAPPVSPSPAVVPAAARATLDIELYAKRAGTNLLSAAVEYDIILTNKGEAVARGVQVDVRLLSAGIEQDGMIGTLFSSPIERPITQAFDLPPRGAIELSGMAMMPKEMVSVMPVKDRSLFVPVLAINLLYGWEGGSGQTAASYVVGIDRGDGAKLTPFRLDGTPRMHDGVSTLPYTVSIRR